MSLSRRQFIKASGVALCAGAAPLKAHAAGQQLALPVPNIGSAAAGIASRSAAVSDAAAFALVVYARHSRPRLGDQWPLHGADDPRLERGRRQAYLQQPSD